MVGMKKLLYLALLIIFPISYAEQIDNQWGPEEGLWGDKNLVSVNGEVTYGDYFRLVFRPESEESCDEPASYTTFYTIVDNADEKFENLPSKYITTVINEDEKFASIIDHTVDFIAGKRSLLYLATLDTESFVNYQKDFEKITIQLYGFYDLDTQQQLPDDINEYFDITKNTWSLNGLEEAVKAGKERCIANIGKETKL
jgi:hypothetical protein